jgi:hypothetical protein
VNKGNNLITITSMRKGKLNPKLNLEDQHHLLVQLNHLQNKQNTKKEVIAKWQG